MIFFQRITNAVFISLKEHGIIEGLLLPHAVDQFSNWVKIPYNGSSSSTTEQIGLVRTRGGLISFPISEWPYEMHFLIGLGADEFGNLRSLLFKDGVLMTKAGLVVLTANNSVFPYSGNLLGNAKDSFKVASFNGSRSSKVVSFLRSILKEVEGPKTVVEGFKFDFEFIPFDYEFPDTPEEERMLQLVVLEDVIESGLKKEEAETTEEAKLSEEAETLKEILQKQVEELKATVMSSIDEQVRKQQEKVRDAVRDDMIDAFHKGPKPPKSNDPKNTENTSSSSSSSSSQQEVLSARLQAIYGANKANTRQKFHKVIGILKTVLKRAMKQPKGGKEYMNAIRGFVGGGGSHNVLHCHGASTTATIVTKHDGGGKDESISYKLFNKYLLNILQLANSLDENSAPTHSASAPVKQVKGLKIQN